MKVRDQRLPVRFARLPRNTVRPSARTMEIPCNGLMKISDRDSRSSLVESSGNAIGEDKSRGSSGWPVMKTRASFRTESVGTQRKRRQELPYLVRGDFADLLVNAYTALRNPIH